MSKIKLTLLSNTENPVEVIAMAGKLCYSKSNISDILEKMTPEQTEAFVNRLVSYGHESPLEHVSFTFGVEGISRACSHQIVRHRIASYCLSGDTEVITDKCNGSTEKRTIKQLYDMKKQYRDMTHIRSVNENTLEILNNKIVDVVQSGVKKLYEVETNDGYKILTTLEHKYFTPNGWKRLNELKEGDTVYTNGIPAYKNKDWLETKYRKENILIDDIAKMCGCSYDTIRVWIAKFGLQKPHGTGMTGRKPPNYGKTKENYTPLMRTSQKMMGNKNYRDMGGENNPQYKRDRNTLSISGGYSECHRKFDRKNVCEMCGDKTHTEIHHIDKNPKNNSNENLIELCMWCHKREHLGWKVKCVKPSTIKSIKFVKEEMTYDIEMMAPHHNFIANGFVVHNSQQSQRYVDLKETFDYVTPKILFDMDEHYSDMGYVQDFQEDMETIHDMYTKWQRRIEEFVKETNYPTYGMTPSKVANENARAVLPNACETKLVFTFNLRTVIHFIKHRKCRRAQDEIRELAILMEQILTEKYPIFKNILGAPCQLGKCPEGTMTCKVPYEKIKK